MRPAGSRGQSTVEFAVVTAGVIALVAALGVLAQKLEDGVFLSHVLAGASHCVQSAQEGCLADIFSY